MPVVLIGTIPTFAAVGKAQTNFAQGEMTAQAFINLFNSASYPFFSGGATPAVLDNDGYPVQNFTGLISGAFGVLDFALSTAGPWVFSWPAGRSAFQFILDNPATLSSAVNATFINGAGSGSPTITGDGVHAGSITINFNTTPGNVHFFFDGTYVGNYASNTSGVMSIVRSSDIAAFNAGIYWAPELISTIKNLHPRSLRLMGLNLPRQDTVDSNVAIWAARLNTTSLAFAFPGAYPNTLKSGGVNAFNAATYNSATGLYTADPASSTSLAGWVNGETLITSLPSAAPVSTISGAVSNGGKVQLSADVTLGLSAGNRINIFGVSGTTEANGFQTIQSVDNAAVNLTGTTNGTTSVTSLSTTTGLFVGQNFTGFDIPAGATISSINVGASSLVLSAAATGSNIGESLIGNGRFTIGATFVNAYVNSFGVVGYQSLTITGKSGGSKIFFTHLGAPIGAAFDPILTGDATFVYDSVLDVVLYTSGPPTPGPPIEVQAQLANLVNAHLWYNIPTWADDTFIINTVNAAYPILNSNLKLIVEYSNEIWNFNQFAFHWTTARANALGLTGGFGDYQALRNRQIFGNLLPATSWGVAMSRLERFYGIQGGTGDTGITFYFDGTDLIAGTSTAYNNFTGGGGGQSYNVAPNRPIDFTDVFGYAPYVPSTTLCGQSPDGGFAPLPPMAPTLQSIADNYNAGGSGITTAIALVDDDVRQGRYGIQNLDTVNTSGTTFATPSPHGFFSIVAPYNTFWYDNLRFTATGGTLYSGLAADQVYAVATVPTTTTFTLKPVVQGSLGATVNAGTQGTGTTDVGTMSLARNIFGLQDYWFTKWEAVAASYDASRPAAGLPNLKVEWYEGALEPTAPTAAECFAIGVTLPGDPTGGTASTAIANAIVAWKNDPSSAATIQLYYNMFMGLAAGYTTTGLMPHSVSPAHLVVMGGGVYGLVANESFMSPSFYQLYNGFAAFSAP